MPYTSVPPHHWCFRTPIHRTSALGRTCHIAISLRGIYSPAVSVQPYPSSHQTTSRFGLLHHCVTWEPDAKSSISFKAFPTNKAPSLDRHLAPYLNPPAAPCSFRHKLPGRRPCHLCCGQCSLLSFCRYVYQYHYCIRWYNLLPRPSPLPSVRLVRAVMLPLDSRPWELGREKVYLCTRCRGLCT